MSCLFYTKGHHQPILGFTPAHLGATPPAMRLHTMMCLIDDFLMGITSFKQDIILGLRLKPKRLKSNLFSF